MFPTKPIKISHRPAVRPQRNGKKCRPMGFVPQEDSAKDADGMVIGLATTVDGCEILHHLGWLKP